MKRAVLTTALAACMAAATAEASGSTPGFAGCAAYFTPHAKLVTKPASIQAACGDGNFFFTKLAWSAWTSTSARAIGTAHQNDCTPSCAAGHFHAYPVRVTLSAVRVCPGRREFTRLAWTFTAGRPNALNGPVPRSSSETFRCA